MYPNKKTARIENWIVRAGCLEGFVYDDRQERFKDGDLITTSPIMHQNSIYAETKNSVYILGKPAPEPEKHELLQFFGYAHLPKHLQAVSKLFHDLAHTLNLLPDNSQKTGTLSRLLEAKDCAVRAALFQEVV